MSHPIVIAEYHQTKRHILLSSVVLIVIVIAMRFFLGASGVALGLFFFLPTISLQIGIGTFAEEFSKGNFKFLYALPVSRFSIWAVKCVSAILAILVFSLVCLVVFLGFPDESIIEARALLQDLDITPSIIGAMVAAHALYSCMAGMFSITMCASIKTAGFLSFALMYLPLIVLSLMFYTQNSLSPPPGIVLVLMTGAITLMIGSLVQFTIRNPFLERPWLWRGVGCIFMVILVASLCISSAVAMLLPKTYASPRFDHMINAHPSPDGKRMLVVTRENLIGTHGYILSTDGSIEKDLGFGVSLMQKPKLTWSTSTEGTMILYAQNTGSLLDVFGGESNKLVLHNLNTDQTVFLRHLNFEGNEDIIYSYKAWSADHKNLLGTQFDYSDNSLQVKIFSQNLTTDNVTEILVSEGNSTYLEYLDSGRVMQTIYAEADGSTTKKVIIFDPLGGAQREYALPTETETWDTLPDGETAIFVRKFIEANAVGFEVFEYDLATGVEKMLVNRTYFPQVTLQQAARNQVGYVHITASQSGQWLICSLNDFHSNNDVELLVNRTDRSVFQMTEGGDGISFEEVVFSPGDKRVALVDREYPENQPSEDAEQQTITRLRVIELGSEGIHDLCAIELAGTQASFKWLGQNKIVYLRTTLGDNFLQSTTKLWVIDLTDCAYQPLLTEYSLEEIVEP